MNCARSTGSSNSTKRPMFVSSSAASTSSSRTDTEAREEEREQERDRAERLLTTRQERQARHALAAGAARPRSRLPRPRPPARSAAGRPSPPGKGVCATSAKFASTAVYVSAKRRRTVSSRSARSFSSSSRLCSRIGALCRELFEPLLLGVVLLLRERVHLTESDPTPLEPVHLLRQFLAVVSLCRFRSSLVEPAARSGLRLQPRELDLDSARALERLRSLPRSSTSRAPSLRSASPSSCARWLPASTRARSGASIRRPFRRRLRARRPSGRQAGKPGDVAGSSRPDGSASSAARASAAFVAAPPPRAPPPR